MNIKKQYYLAVLIVAFALLAFPRVLLSQDEKLAVISSFEGQVKIKHGGVWRTVTKIGNRMRNSTVYSGDTVFTMPGTKAVLVFNDDTRMDVREDTTMVVFEEQIAGKASQQGYVTNVAGVPVKEVVRNIDIKTGGLRALITPSRSVLTEFEACGGTATVRGTALSLACGGSGLSLELEEGLVDFSNQEVLCKLEEPVMLNASDTEEGTLLEAESGHFSAMIKDEDGMITGMSGFFDAGDSAEIQMDNQGFATFIGNEGMPRFDTPLGIANIEKGVSITSRVECADVCRVTFGTNKGKVTLGTAVGDMDIGEGDVITAVSDTDTGEVNVTAEAGTIEYKTSKGTAIIEENETAEIAVDAETGEVTISAKAGTIECKTNNGVIIIEEGNTTGFDVDAETGEVIISADVGALTFTTAAGTATIEEGTVVGVNAYYLGGTQIDVKEGAVRLDTAVGTITAGEGSYFVLNEDTDTGETTISTGWGTSDVTLDTEGGTVKIAGGRSATTMVDESTGTVTLKTGAGTLTVEAGAVFSAMVGTVGVGTTYSSEEGNLALTTAAGTTTIEEGTVVGVHVDYLGDTHIGVKEGTVTLDTAAGTVTAVEGSRFDYKVDTDTGETTIGTKWGTSAVTLDTAGGTVTIVGGGAATTMVDESTGTFTLNTKSGTLTVEEGAVFSATVGYGAAGTTYSSEEGTLALTTPAGTTTINEGTVVEVFVDYKGTTNVDVKEGTVVLDTVAGTVTAGAGSKFTQKVDANTGETTIAAGYGTDAVSLDTTGGTVTLAGGGAATTMVDESTGTVTLNTSAGTLTVEEGAVFNVTVDTTGTTYSSEEGTLALATAAGTTTIGEGTVVGVHVDYLGRTNVDVKEGTVVLDTAAGSLTAGVGSKFIHKVDTDTGETTLRTLGGGAVTLDTAGGTVTIAGGSSATTMVDESTGTFTLNTAGGTLTVEEGAVFSATVGTGAAGTTYSSEEGTLALTTASGTTTINEGTVVGVYVTYKGDTNIDVKEGTIILDTAAGTVTAGVGSKFTQKVNADTGATTITANWGTSDVTLDTGGGTVTIAGGSSATTMVDESTGIFILNTKSGTLTAEAGAVFSATVDTSTVAGTTYSSEEGTLVLTTPAGATTIKEGTVVGVFVTHKGDTHVDVKEGNFTIDTTAGSLTVGKGSTFVSTANTGTSSTFTGTFTDLKSGIYTGTFAEGSGFTGTYTDLSGNVFNLTDFRESSFIASAVDSTSDPAPPSTWESNATTTDTNVTSAEWDTRTNAYTANDFGPIVETTTPTAGKGSPTFTDDFNSDFAVIHTGKGNQASSGTLEKEFEFTTGNRQISFDYNFVTTEYLNRGGSTFNDYFKVELHQSDGSIISLIDNVNVETSTFTSVSGLPTDTLDLSTGGQTGWKSFDEIVNILVGGTTLLHFHVNDVGDDTHDSAVLLDNVIDPPVTSTDYLLTFAKMLRGDMEAHEDEHTDDAASKAEHQTSMDAMDDVIDDIEINISNPDAVDKTKIFNALKIARDLLMDHEEMKESVQHASLAHLLLDSKIMADDQVSINLVSIYDSINQVKNFMEEHINDFGETAAHSDIKYQINSILAKIGMVQDNIYDIAAANAIRNEVQGAFCDVVDHTTQSHSEGEENQFHFCHKTGAWIAQN